MTRVRRNFGKMGMEQTIASLTRPLWFRYLLPGWAFRNRALTPEKLPVQA
jgi:hypothetical protein